MSSQSLRTTTVSLFCTLLHFDQFHPNSYHTQQKIAVSCLRSVFRMLQAPSLRSICLTFPSLQRVSGCVGGGIVQLIELGHMPTHLLTIMALCWCWSHIIDIITLTQSHYQIQYFIKFAADLICQYLTGLLAKLPGTNVDPSNPQAVSVMHQHSTALYSWGTIIWLLDQWSEVQQSIVSPSTYRFSSVVSGPEWLVFCFLVLIYSPED